MSVGFKTFAATVRAVNGANNSKKFVSNRSAIVLTEAAVKRIKRLIEGKDGVIGLRIGVKQRGCNGLSYSLDYVKQKQKFDEEVIQDGVRVLIDSKAQLSLLGTEMDFVETKLSSEFVFNNPNVKGTCGCGESFTI
ncbi:iron-sulfur cluster assembly 1 homolog, mitochondrial-like [Oppia nitens]|uniref:iron-sulfur cluster assembly 1 homolog, mitochondrial-like n=1 Tax=Oppia nitens TaxID=1686743 RepID=UPI0023DA4BA6|nr:iron-sulfur cluster assembly 1 homolog, mitochondrial-like [Oppia nitens]